MDLTTLWTSSPRRRDPLELLIWALLTLAVLHALLLHTVSDPLAPPVLYIRMLQPLGAFGAVGLLALAARRLESRQQRYAWWLHACGIFSSSIGTVLSIFGLVYALPLLTSVSYPFFGLTYIFALIGTGLLLPIKSWVAGSAIRVLLDGFTIALALFVCLESSILYPADPALHAYSLEGLWYIAADAGVLFAVAVAGFSYRRGGPLLAYGLLSVICLLLTDIVHLLLANVQQRENWVFVIGPLLTLHRTLLGVGVYRSVSQPPQSPELIEHANIVPITTWLGWMAIPQSLALLVIAIVVLSGNSFSVTMIVLICILIGRDILAGYDVWRVVNALNRAREQERESRQLVRFVQHELRGYTNSLSGILEQLDALLSSPLSTSADIDRQDARFLVEALRIGSGQANDLLQQLLILSRDAESIHIQQRRVQLRELVDEAVQTVVAGFSREIEVANLVEPLLAVRGDPFYLAMAVRTALENSADSLQNIPRAQHARISVSARQQGERVVLRLEDTGVGFPTELTQQAHMRGVEGIVGWTSKAGGHGLGLALLERVALLHEGRQLTLGNNASVGAWVEIDLPRWAEGEEVSDG